MNWGVVDSFWRVNIRQKVTLESNLPRPKSQCAVEKCERLGDNGWERWRRSNRTCQRHFPYYSSPVTGHSKKGVSLTLGLSNCGRNARTLIYVIILIPHISIYCLHWLSSGLHYWTEFLFNISSKFRLRCNGIQTSLL